MSEALEEPPNGGGILYVVATPIGNLEDMTFRAVRILREVDIIAAEDTRHSRKLCAHFGISTPLTSCFAHNEAHKGEHLVQRLCAGANVALISDAGTPAISDPGAVLVRQSVDAGIAVVPIPGASAVIAALCAAGLPTDMFTFVGFVPAKKNQRAAFLQRWGALDHTLIAYEAPHRLEACLEDVCTLLGEKRELVVARELTKVHEELYRGSARAALEHFGSRRAKGERIKGEIVLLLGAQPPQEVEESVGETVGRLLLNTDLSLRRISKEVAQIHPVSASEAYALAMKMRQEMK
ncbi:MAG: 16S rRNA (cytidine(1402)-2'-O)-methyltransferase [Desulfuromonadaceae bacterium]|nr:16S rRNA (cytidine(1402)-2'-O)-methyltransferase [Geobacteraceae bacterium]